MRSATTPEERFWAYHNANPGVYRAFYMLALRLYLAGARHIGAKALFEYLRFQTLLDTRASGQPFKLCNEFTPYYARLLCVRDPRFGKVFTLRQLRSMR